MPKTLISGPLIDCIDIQLKRFAGTRLTCNAGMGPNEVRVYCETDASGEKLMKAAGGDVGSEVDAVSDCVHDQRSSFFSSRS